MPINTDSYVHKQVVCANVLVQKGERYLVIRRSPMKSWASNTIHFIGGKVEADENPAEAARREVREEAGLEITNLRLVAVNLEIRPLPDRSDNWLIFDFMADAVGDEAMESDEGELVWLNRAEVQQAETHCRMSRFRYISVS